MTKAFSGDSLPDTRSGVDRPGLDTGSPSENAENKSKGRFHESGNGPQQGRPGLTVSQTVGPFFHYCLTPKAYGYAEIVTNDLLTEDAAGERIRIEGRVFDGDGQPVADALVEIWQADGHGRYASPGDNRPRPNTRFKGFGRSACDAEGRYRFTTVKPGPVPGPNGALQAPHINVSVFARGVLRQLFTRIYFDGEPANASDPILALVPAEARGTLIAKRATQGGEPTYTFDIHLQGQNETVFFEA